MKKNIFSFSKYYKMIMTFVIIMFCCVGISIFSNSDGKSDYANADAKWENYTKSITLVHAPYNISYYTTSTYSNYTTIKTIDEYYEISTAEQLAYFSKYIDSFKYSNIKLVKNIDLKDKIWTPIGKSSETPFCGIFDGNNCVISGLSIKNSSIVKDTSAGGLFGYVNGAIICNVILNNASVYLDNKSSAVGVLVGEIYSGETFISKCECTGSISINKFKSTDACVGGLIGKSTEKTVLYFCHSKVDIFVVTGYEDHVYVGGIIGYLQKGYIMNCFNEKNLEAYADYDNELKQCVMGGIVGYVYYNVQILECGNIGNIFACYSCSDYCEKTFCGGIVGLDGYYYQYENNANCGVYVTNCYNRGNLWSYAKKQYQKLIKGKYGSININRSELIYERYNIHSFLDILL